MNRSLALLVALLLLVAPAARADDQHGELLADADRIAKKVSALRGLRIKKPIKRGVMNKEQITERLLLRVKQEYAPDEIAREELALKRLGLLAAGADYLETVIELLKAQIAGFYDPWEKQLYIMEGTGALGGEEVMAHEIDHALQDQHFDLKKWLAEVRKNADATLARQALVEGDGTVLMLEYALGDKGAAPWGDPDFVQQQAATIRMGLVLMADVPLFLRESLVFPYVNGLKFVGHARASKAWKQIDGMYARPPLSTEHIIHPEKYERYEPPVEIKAAVPATIEGYRRGHDNVMGELALWILLRQHGVDEGVAKNAVAGWGGDRIAVFTPPGYDRVLSASVAVVYTVWDAQADADEFFAAAAQALPGISGGQAVRSGDRRVVFRGADGTMSSVERRGDAVVLVVGAVPARAAELRGQVWKAWTVKRR